jgi:hypothetical protein
MHQTPARTPHRPARQEPETPDSDLLGRVVRGALAVVFGCGGAVIFLALLTVLLSLVLG